MEGNTFLEPFKLYFANLFQIVLILGHGVPKILILGLFLDRDPLIFESR